MFVNRQVKRVDNEPASGSLWRPVASVDADTHPAPYRVATPEPVGTPVVTEDPTLIIPPVVSQPQAHRDEGVQLERFRDNIDPVGPDTGLQ